MPILYYNRCMKKIHAIYVVVLVSLVTVYVADRVYSYIESRLPVRASEKDIVHNESSDNPYLLSYIQDEFGFSFMYDNLLLATAEQSPSEGVLLRVEVSPMSEYTYTLTGLLTIEVSTTPLALSDPSRAYIGDTEVKKYTHTIKDTTFVTFEKKLRNNQYLRIRLPKEYYDMTFDPDVYADEEMSEMVDASMAIQEVLRSFTFDVK